MLSLTNFFLVAIGFLGMEAITYLVHRFVMHGALQSLHRSHHRNAAAAFAKKTPEPNDVFPLAFSVLVIGGVSMGFNISGAAWLLPVLVGVTVYGIAFEAPTGGRTQISQCATSSAHYFNAAGLQIRTAFRAIASNISHLRLTQ